MSDDIIKEVAIEVFKEQGNEIYTDGFKPATQEAGEALQTIVGLVNNVIFYPLKKLNFTYKYKFSQFQQDFIEKTKNIPEKNIVEPPLNIVGPTIEALKYTIDTEELREMYLNLLASSINIEKVENAHPGYVDIIRQMTSLDAHIFKDIIKINGNIASARITMCFDNLVYTRAMPNIFAPELLKQYDPFLVSSSIENLCRLGLISHLDNTIKGFDYNDFKEHPYVVSRFEIFKDIDKTLNLYINVSGNELILNDFGKSFGRVCL